MKEVDARRCAFDFGKGVTVEIIHGDVAEVDFTDATHMFVYLVPEGLKKINKPMELCINYGNKCKVVSYIFGLGLDFEPKKIEVYKTTKIYLY